MEKMIEKPEYKNLLTPSEIIQYIKIFGLQRSFLKIKLKNIYFILKNLKIPQ